MTDLDFLISKGDTNEIQCKLQKFITGNIYQQIPSRERQARQHSPQNGVKPL